VVLIVATAYLLYERYTQKARVSESSLYIEALRDLLDRQQESAFTKLRQVVASDSGNIDAYLRLGQILREHSRPDRALQVHKDLTLRGGLSKDEKVAILRQLTLDYVDLKEHETAEAALKELILLSPQSQWGHRQLLALQEKGQKWEAAYETAAALLRLEANKSKKPLAKFKYQSGLQLYRKREYHKARVILKEAIGLDPTLVEAYLAIGDSYFDEKRLEDAANFWKKLISAVPEQGHTALDRLKKVMFELGRFGEVAEICESILDHDPKNVGARRTLAEFYEKKGDLDAAVETLERIVDDDPNDLSSIVELIRFYVEKDDRRKLSELLRNLQRKTDARGGSAPKPASGSSVPLS
jgi:lipopolysaccharide biosynthesis regulator YciM